MEIHKQYATQFNKMFVLALVKFTLHL